MDKVVYAETKFVIFAEKSNESFSICQGFSKIVCNMSPDSKLCLKKGYVLVRCFVVFGKTV